MNWLESIASPWLRPELLNALTLARLSDFSPPLLIRAQVPVVPVGPARSHPSEADGKATGVGPGEHGTSNLGCSILLRVGMCPCA